MTLITLSEVQETNNMIQHENLDVRTITMGINLMDCMTDDVDRLCDNIYSKITRLAKDLVSVGNEIGLEFGVPIVNKRVSVTPIAMVGSSACKTKEDFVKIAKTLDRAAKTVGVNFIGGYSALVMKGITNADRLLIESIPKALSSTERVCSSISLGSTKTGINMDAVRMMGDIVKETAEATKENDSIGCAKLVVFCNPPDDNPFMAGAFHGVTEADRVINVGVSGPGVVKYELSKVRGQDLAMACIIMPEKISRLSVTDDEDMKQHIEFLKKVSGIAITARMIGDDTILSGIFNFKVGNDAVEFSKTIQALLPQMPLISEDEQNKARATVNGTSAEVVIPFKTSDTWDLLTRVTINSPMLDELGNEDEAVEGGRTPVGE